MNDTAGDDLPEGVEGQSKSGCPICGKPGNEDYRPFCSKRCADVDLGRWLSGRYAIPVVDDHDEDGDMRDEISAGLSQTGKEGDT